VQPDIVCLAKSLGGGLPVAAVGGTAEVMEHVASGEYEITGTFNVNPLGMAATRAMLYEVATPQAYRRIEELGTRAASGIGQAIAATGLAAHVVSAGAKGCVVFSPQPVRNYRISCPSTTGTATRTGCSSTTAGSSCRRGGRSSSG
jgi:glutamate-1-semialdehyde 2,1-aminomutase